MSGCGKHRFHIVLFLCCHGAYTLAAAALCAIFADRQALDITTVGQRIYTLFLFYQVLNVDFIGHILNLGKTLVAVFIAYCYQLVLQNALDFFFISQQLVVVFNLCAKLFFLIFQLFAIKTLQCYKTHVTYGLSLNVTEIESLHQSCLGIVIAGADYADNFINIILSNKQTLQQMLPLHCLLEVELGTADDQFFLELEIFIKNAAQREYLRLALIVDKGQHID